MFFCLLKDSPNQLTIGNIQIMVLQLLATENRIFCRDLSTVLANDSRAISS